MRKVRFLLLLCCFCICTITQAQKFDKKHLSIEGQVSFGKMAKLDSKIKEVLLSNDVRFYDLSLNYNTLPSDSSRFASAYNYPTFGLGFTVADFSSVHLTNQSRINTIFVLSGFIDRNLIRNKHLSFGYKLNAGLAYANNPYDPIKNPDNIFISSPLMVYIGFGFNVKYKPVNRLAIGLSADFRHISNGRTGMPNKGINMFSAGVSATYYLDKQQSDFTKIHKNDKYRKHLIYHLALHSGIQSSIEEWSLYSEKEADPAKKKTDFQKYPIISLSADIMYRYSLKFGTGIGVDLFYTSHTDKLKEWDSALSGINTSRQEYNPLSVGLSINQEVYYKNLSLFVAVGYYVYRELGLQKKEKFYQRAGFRYYLPPTNSVFMGISIKAHKFCTADYLEFSIGYKF
ncbi:MAG: acyloxyacyl hydrolase [Bacteroidales bacterium]|nr:acyloxyacyl hydrolase [Bacteroidales bacterium]